MSAQTDEVIISPPDDFHLHLRDGDPMKNLVFHASRQFRRAIIMPNLRPPVVTTAQAHEYRSRILGALKAVSGDHAFSSKFEPLMTLYLTDNTTPEEIQKAKDCGFVFAAKLYPAGATTNSDSGVTNIRGIYPVLRKMAEVGLPLCVHGEVTDSDIDIFDRERVFIERVLKPLIADIPQLRMIMEHVTTKDAVEFVLSAGDNVAATITAHHLIYNRNIIFQGGLNPHYYCLPVLKKEEHRQALVKAAISGNPKFFAGSDSAAHAKGNKESCCGAAGCFTGYATLELYLEAFDNAGALDKFHNFVSSFGAQFYRIPVNASKSEDKLRLVRKQWTVPDSYQYGDGSVVPLRAGQTMAWSVQ